MKNIKDNFIPYEEAKELKELGFDEECFGRYSHSQSSLIYCFILNHNLNQSFQSAPLWQQAFDFFNEKYGIFVYYTPAVPTSFIPNIHFSKEEGLKYKSFEMGKFFGRRTFDTFEEAQLETLRKLIELIKNTKI